MCFGIDDEPVTTGQDVKSVSEEMTFAEDIIGIGGLKPHLADLCQNVCFSIAEITPKVQNRRCKG